MRDRAECGDSVRDRECGDRVVSVSSVGLDSITYTMQYSLSPGLDSLEDSKYERRGQQSQFILLCVSRAMVAR